MRRFLRALAQKGAFRSQGECEGRCFFWDEKKPRASVYWPKNNELYVRQSVHQGTIMGRWVPSCWFMLPEMWKPQSNDLWKEEAKVAMMLHHIKMLTMCTTWIKVLVQGPDPLLLIWSKFLLVHPKVQNMMALATAMHMQPRGSDSPSSLSHFLSLSDLQESGNN